MPVLHPLPLRALAVAVAAVCVLSAHAQAPSIHHYDLPTQPLGSTLARIAGTSGQQISIDAELVRGLNASVVRGSYTPEQAAQAALADSGLELVKTGSGTWTLRKSAPPAARAVAPVAVASATAAPATGTTLQTVTVTAEAERSATTEGSGSYTTRQMGTATGLGLSIRETPQTVTVVTRQQMDDQNLAVLEDVLAQSAGFSKSQRNFGAHVFTLRGYEIDDENYLIDGVSGTNYATTGWVPMDMAVFDRVEVLRGAGGLVVGAGDPSGVINMVRKRPRTEKHLDLALSAGSWNNYRAEIDAGGPLNAEGTVRGRVVAAYQDREQFYDIAHQKAPLFYGVIDVDLGRDTKLTLGARHQETTIDGYTIFGLPRYTNGLPLDVARSTQLAQRWNRHDATTDELFAEVEQQLQGDWKARFTINHSKTGVRQKMASARGAVDPTTLAGTRLVGVYDNDYDMQATGLDASVGGSFTAWGGTHQAMVGANLARRDITYRSNTLPLSIPVDPFHFNHDLLPEPVMPTTWDSVRNEKVDRSGIYASTRLELAPPLHVLLGGRLSWYAYKATDVLASAVTSDYRQNAEFTPYAGVVYDLDSQWSAYASYADSFRPQSQYATLGGALLKPAVGANYEAGLKAELMDKKLNLALAVFKGKKRNVAVQDFDNAGLCPGITTNDCYRNASVLRTQGFDIDVTGQLVPGWNVAAGYTYFSSRDDEGSSLNSDAPRNMLRASTSYRLPGEWSAWTVGGALSAQSRTYIGDLVQNPGRAVLDLHASYRFNSTWTAALNVGNVTDKHYWATIGGTRNGNYWGTPRNATLTVRGSF